MDRNDSHRYADLIQRTTPGLVLYARQWCDAAEDVVQEALMKLVSQSLPPENPTAWLFRVVRNDAINAARSQSRRGHHEEAASAERSAWFDPASGDGIDRDLAAAALRDEPEEIRETIVARLWGGMTFDEIAELSGVSPRTASRRYQTGLESLRQKMGFVHEKESQ